MGIVLVPVGMLKRMVMPWKTQSAFVTNSDHSVITTQPPEKAIGPELDH